MFITYNNPDEVVKVKHILSLGEHIADKIDGFGSSSSSSSVSKTTPTLTASATTFSAATFTDSAYGKQTNSICTLTYNGDGEFFIDKNAITTTGLTFMVKKNSGGLVGFFPGYVNGAEPTWPVTFKVGFTETDNYKAASVEMTITA